MGWAHPQPQASPSLQEPGGCARQVAPLYLPTGSRAPGGGRGAWGWVGWWRGLLLQAPSPCSVSEPPGTHTSGGSQVFPKKQLKIYPVWTDDLADSWLLAPRQVGVRGRGQEWGPLELSPSER